jgi:hypothetical protein
LASWTRDLRAPRSAPRVGDGPGARFLDLRGIPSGGAVGGDPWECCIRVAPISTSTGRRWWLTCVTWRTAPSTARCGRSRRPAGLVGMAGQPGDHAPGDGGDRSLSETGLAHSERRRLYPGVGQCRHVKNVPGRKAGVNDATWLADLMAHGLIRGSFVPDVQTQELRGLLRTRKQYVRERSSRIQHLQKTLEDANIKLDSIQNTAGSLDRGLAQHNVLYVTLNLSHF